MTITGLRNNFFDALKGIYSKEEAGSIFYILTSEILSLSRLDIALKPLQELSEIEVQQFQQALQKLQQHQPVQYVTGSTEFFGLPFKVNSHVLIPRPETEELVQWILDDVQGSKRKDLRILDIGTGSGCIAIVLAKKLPQAKISAIDLSREALFVAKKNAELHQVKVELLEQDILKTENLVEEYDLIVSNPPYVRDLEKAEMQKNVLNFEPKTALYVCDEDPLIFYNKITTLAAAALTTQGALYFEVNQYLGEQTEKILREKDFLTTLKKDIFGVHRMLKGKKR